MLIKDEHFRNYYKRPVVIYDNEFSHEIARTLKIDSIMADDPSGDEIQERLKSIEIDENINSIVAVPYINHTAGISFMILANSKADKSSIEIFKREDFSVMINCRKDKVDNCEFEYLDNLNVNRDFDPDDYSNLIESLENYRVNDDVELLRSLEILDNSREATFPDDIMVYFFKEGFDVEGMWVRYERIVEEPVIEGILLNTPNQDLGIKSGDKVKIFPYKPDEDEEVMVICNLDMQ